MKLHDVVQGSDEWNELRLRSFTASEAAAMMDQSKYCTRDELLRFKKTGSSKEVSDFVQKFIFDKGHETEAMARPVAEDIMSGELFPVTGSIIMDGMQLLSSYDGLTMPEDEIWEHKQWNETLSTEVSSGNINLPDHYWQLEQQLLVSGAEGVLFMVSDGTEENMVYVWYESNPERREQLIEGWKQFNRDLLEYKVEDIKVKPMAQSIDSLPTLSIAISGEVKSTNLAEYQSTVKNFISGINKELTTDQHFADAEKTVKFCKSAEDEIANVKAMVLGQAATVNDVFKALDNLKEEMRQVRLNLNNKVKAEKENIKNGILAESRQKLQLKLAEIESELQGAKIEITTPDLVGAIKNKRTIESLKNAVNSSIAAWEIEAHKQAAMIRTNLKIIAGYEEEYPDLFMDKKNIVNQEPDNLENLAKVRIAEFKEREAKKEAEMRERLEKEQAEKLAAEQAEVIEDQPAVMPRSQSPQLSRKTTKSPLKSEELTDYQEGYIQGLRAYAHWKDGVEYVGTSGKTLNEAIQQFMNKTEVA